MKKCKKCQRFKKIHTHHITYKPERTEFLCYKCHGYISSIDSLARQLFRKLFQEKIKRNSLIDNSLRKLFFFHFIKADITIFDRPQRKKFVKEILSRFIIS